jgi:hypothetical protein
MIHLDPMTDSLDSEKGSELYHILTQAISAVGDRCRPLAFPLALWNLIDSISLTYCKR